MTNPAPSPSPTVPGWLNSYGVVWLGAVCVTVAEIFLKRGAMATAINHGFLPGFGTSALASGWTWVGILVYIASFGCWLQALRRMPLHLAFSLMSVVQVLVPLGSWWFLGETIGLYRWCGIALVLAGIVVIAAPAMRAEEQL